MCLLCDRIFSMNIHMKEIDTQAMTEYNCQSSPVQSSPVQSVIIPTFNRKELLADAINSVLKQSLRDIEVIVADDCSTDSTEDFVRSIPDERVRYLRNADNSGSEVSRLNAFRQARGKYITFLDDDDYYTDYEFFAKAVEIHENSESPLAFVCADGLVLEVQTGLKTQRPPLKPGRVRGTDFILQWEKEYRKPTSLFPAVFRADVLRQAGLSDMMIFDSQTYMLASLFGDVYVIPDVVGTYRSHPESNTLGRKSSGYNSRRHANFAERLRQNKIVTDELYRHCDKKAVDSFCIFQYVMETTFFTAHSKGLADSVNFYKTLYANSDFSVKLWLALFRERLDSNIRCFLKKIPGLRKLYRHIKYGEEL